MPVATPKQYAEMLDKAKTKGFAYPAVNVSSSSTINAVLQGLSEAQSDGIIQVTTGGADYFAGQTVKNRASGALAFAAFVTEVAKNYPVTVALHTDKFVKVVKSVTKVAGLPEAPMAFVPQPVMGKSAAELRAYVDGKDPATGMPVMQEVIQALTMALQEA